MSDAGAVLSDENHLLRQEPMRMTSSKQSASVSTPKSPTNTFVTRDRSWDGSRFSDAQDDSYQADPHWQQPTPLFTPVKPGLPPSPPLSTASSQAVAFFEPRARLPQHRNSRTQTILREALEVSLRCFRPASSGPIADQHTVFEEPQTSASPSIELLELMLISMDENSPVSHLCFLGGASVLSKEALQRNGLALIAGTVQKPLKTHLAVIVNFQAWSTLAVRAVSAKTESMRDALLARRDELAAQVRSALDQISIGERPSLSLFQALVAGAIFTQTMGDFETSWQLNCAASRICIALGGQTLLNAASRSDHGEAKYIWYCLAVCYILDKAMSLCMNAVPALPDLDIKADLVTPVDTSKPWTMFMHLYLKMSKVQDHIGRLSRGKATSSASLAAVQTLQTQMWSVKSQVQEFKQCTSRLESTYVDGQWLGIDFMYFSIMTCIMQIHPYVEEDPELKQQAVGYARRAIESLRAMQEHTARSPERQLLRMALSWKVSMYPLAPFFVLFRHFVDTPDPKILELMSTTTSQMIDLAEGNESITTVAHLFSAFIDLAKRVDASRSQAACDDDQQSDNLTVSSGQAGVSTDVPGFHTLLGAGRPSAAEPMAEHITPTTPLASIGDISGYEMSNAAGQPSAACGLNGRDLAAAFADSDKELQAIYDDLFASVGRDH